MAGDGYSRMYASLCLVNLAAPVLGSGDAGLISDTKCRLIIARPTPSKGEQLGGPAQQGKACATAVYAKDGSPLLAVRSRGGGASNPSISFLHSKSGDEAFSVRVSPWTIFGPAMKLYSSSHELICEGRRLNWGGKCTKLGLFLPGQEQPWLVVKGNTTRDDMYVFLGNPKLGGQLVAQLHRRGKLDDFTAQDAILDLPGSLLYDCRLAPNVDWAVVVAAVVLIDYLK